MLGTLQEVVEDMERGVYDFTQNGECSNCGGCCSRFLPVSAKELKIIKRHLKKHPVKEQKHLLPTSEPADDWTCPFRSEKERKCLIYKVRPAICRDFRCDKPAQKIKANREMYYGRYQVVDMRREFLGWMIMDNNSFLSLLDSMKDCGNEQKTHSTNGKYVRPENLMRKTLELVVYDGKIRLHEYPVDGMCLVETPTKSIHKMCKVDPHELEVVCNLDGYRGYLAVSYMREIPEQEKEKWGCNYSESDYRYLSSIHNDTDMGDSFSIVLWAGTVGIGMRESGETEEVTRTKEEAWADLFVNTSKKERCSEISEPQMIPTVKVDGGPNPVIASAIVVPISLIGFIASRAVFWQILLVIEAIALFGMLVKTLIDA